MGSTLVGAGFDGPLGDLPPHGTVPGEPAIEVVDTLKGKHKHGVFMVHEGDPALAADGLEDAGWEVLSCAPFWEAGRVEGAPAVFKFALLVRRPRTAQDVQVMAQKRVMTT